MDAMWRSGPRGHARAPAWRGGDTWHILYLSYIVFYNMYRSSDYRKTIYYSSISKRVIYPINSKNFFGVGLSSLRFLICKTRGATRGVRSKSQ